MPIFPDEKYITIIRDELWTPRIFGRAAVMVGAGFSRNATPNGPSAQKYPLWRDLARSLLERLRGKEFAGNNQAALASASETSGALRLAEEFEAAFGRQQLDAWLFSQIPDDDHKPDKLHTMLLDLPWSDVLTTNYDTLLERTLPDILDKNYGIVRSIDDIPHKQRPRIVKLHGSFPSNRRFIFTEEDFRTYPRQYGAFVNLVQQVLMENVLCLIGFSGDDPNFLHWTGWVRDNLGSNAPPIYLCGLFYLTDSQRRLLARRNVTPIDLSPLFPESSYPDEATRHQLAINWFLLELGGDPRRRPLNPLDWPRESAVIRKQPAHIPAALETLLTRTSLPTEEQQFPNDR